MPGVPSSRGCDACRRQKKKCDQEKPACGRCARLEIECTGSGQQRYKFHNNTVKQPPGQRQSPSSRVPSPGSSSSQNSQTLATRRSRILLSPSGNAQTAITGRLVSALEVSDPRFDLSVYGNFLKGIPRRLGSSPVLDAAASAMAAALPLVGRQTGVNDYDKALQPVSRATVPMLQHYGRALHALRHALSDPSATKDPNTLCALYLVVITQGWLQHEEGHFTSHGEGVSMILRSIKGQQPSWGAFEQSILSTLCFLVIMEGFINPRIRLDDDLWQTPEPNGPPSAAEEPVTILSLHNHFLARVSKMLWTPDTHVRQLVDAYHLVRADRIKLEGLLQTIPLIPSPDGQCRSPVSETMQFIHLRWLTAYAMLTLVAMRIGAVLTKIDANVDNVEALVTVNLASDFHAYNDDIVSTAEQALQYYPLGSSFMPLCLLAAYSALDFTGSDANQRARILRVFSEYRPGFDMDRKLNDIAKAFKPSGHSARGAPRVAVGCGSDEMSAALTQSDLCTVL
ncbi:hypothetical protein SBRCBS47491_000426 [Sporothrix bragantina]|uniref:Zn(2)-C6 fungal-type domain-containing protein n=1 Tax=Sporothrix bragantina TaxID=671064 RepID=A0ABP0AQA2_9PEZI